MKFGGGFASCTWEAESRLLQIRGAADEAVIIYRESAATK